jgi:hypothetical protein
MKQTDVLPSSLPQKQYTIIEDTATAPPQNNVSGNLNDCAATFASVRAVAQRAVQSLSRPNPTARSGTLPSEISDSRPLAIAGRTRRRPVSSQSWQQFEALHINLSESSLFTALITS